SARSAAAARELRDAFVQRLLDEPALRAAVDRRLASIHGLPTDERGEFLAAVERRQNYALLFWRDIAAGLGYRRFFDITDLIGVRVEDPAVFDLTHERILDWVGDGSVDAL